MIVIRIRIIAVLLTVAMTVTLCPVAFAVNPTTVTTNLLKFVEEFESFKAEKYLDQGKYYIGYGMLWDEAKNPNGTITQQEAEQDLKDYMAKTAIPEVSSFLSKHNITVTQNQFDALCSLTYNVGAPAWQNGDVGRYLANGIGNYNNLQIINAFARLCHRASDKAPMVGLVRRRILEAEMFVHGTYTVPGGRVSPNYKWLLMYPNGGTMTYSDIYVYRNGSTYNSLPVVTKAGTTLKGWLVYAEETVPTTSDRYLQPTETVSKNYQLMAIWNNGSTGANPGMELNLANGGGSSTGFVDVSSSDWYYEAVTYCNSKNLMTGTGPRTFSPRGTMTRAMLATVLWSREGKPAVSTTGPFTDVSTTIWYNQPVNWAYLAGVTSGTTPTTFGPNINITREQMVTFLYKYAQYKGYNTTINNNLADHYADRGEIAVWAKDPVEWALENGLMEGSNMSDGTRKIRPKSDILRCENAQVMMKFSKKFG